jgi:hypothetical protein
MERRKEKIQNFQIEKWTPLDDKLAKLEHWLHWF